MSVRALALALAGMASLAVTAGAQQVRRPPEDTTRTDTVQFAPPDSVMQALLDRPGFVKTRYEGGTVTFDAKAKAFAIAAGTANRAVVEREGQLVVTDSGGSIVYNDQTRRVAVTGRRFRIVPGADQPPIAGVGTATYDLAERWGRLTNARVTVADEQGQRWFIDSEIGKTALGDSTRNIPQRFYGLGGTLTSCEDSIPDYHFRMREVKRTDRTLVARPAVLYIRDIPVMWLPFVFQDIRAGRRSGILPPRFGASDIVRNNPGYRRHIENIGYYWAISNYVDMATWANWRSSTGRDSLDRGWWELNAEWKYNWMSRFLDGRLATSYMAEGTGTSRYALSWDHRQRLGRNRNFSAGINYTSSTALQRRNTFNPYQAMATIASTVALSDKMGPLSLSFGANQTQYPGREQIERTLPTVSITSTPISAGEWLVWTPSFRFTDRASLRIDQPGTFSTRFISDDAGRVVRIDTLRRDRYQRDMTIGSPLRIFGMTFTNDLAIRDMLNNFPEEKIFYPGADSANQQIRVFTSTYRTEVDWNPMFSLPSLGQNRFKLTPSVSLQNVDPGPFWLRTELSGGKFVHQTKRLTYGLSANPTLYGIWPGFGPFSRFRHALNPSLSYSFAPKKEVSSEYLEARGMNRQRYLGALRQSAVSFGLSQNIEAKVRTPGDSVDDPQNMRKLKVLSMQFTPLSYDFERAKAVGTRLAGLTTESFGTSLSSDLLPGFDFSMNYSLFEGSTLSDTAVFKPVLTSISSRLQFSQRENPFTVLASLFGRAVPDRSPQPSQDPNETQEGQAMARRFASQPVAGQAARGSQFIVPQTQGWDASFVFSTSRSRPPRGNRVIDYDPDARCEIYRVDQPFAYQACRAMPTYADTLPSSTSGGPAIRIPRQTSLSSDLRFQMTQKWSASWNTSFDFEEHEFASQVVSLQRDLHDWRAVFAFTRSPNGNFAFNFFIALKPQPDLKFDYSRATVRSR